MAYTESIVQMLDVQPSEAIIELQAILDTAEQSASTLLKKLESYRRTGRKGYPPRAMFRAYIASFFLSLKSVNDLHRLLQYNIQVRFVCGLSQLPHRTTFNRFVNRLTLHLDLVQECMVNVVEQLRPELPGLGQDIAVDSTLVRTHSNPGKKKTMTDPDATWGVHHKAGNPEGEDEWVFGYKWQTAVDADYGIPLIGMLTRASGNDFPWLEPLMKLLQNKYDWLDIQHVIADRGYDSEQNSQLVLDLGSSPIIGIRDTTKGELIEGVYTYEGVPTCMGLKPMEYVRSDPERGHLYRCPTEGCHLKDRKGVLYCHDEDWENRQDNPRLWPPVRRGSHEYRRLSGKRWSIEQVYKSQQESRRLAVHYIRLLPRIALHCLVSTLTYCLTALVRIRVGEREYMRWQVRKVA